MKNKNRLLIIIAGAVAGLFVIAAIIVLIIGNSPDGSDNNKESSTDEPATWVPTVEDYYDMYKGNMKVGNTAMALNYAYMYLDEGEDLELIKALYMEIADIYVEYNNYNAATMLLKESDIEGIYEEYCDDRYDLEQYQGLYQDADNEEYYYLGTYPQTGYEANELPSYVVNAEYVDDYAVIYGVSYERVQNEDGYTYFVYEPVRWWAIGEDTGRIVLMSENIIDTKPLADTFSAVTWDVSDLRDWLNDDFYNKAFTDNDKKHITMHFTPASNNYYFDVTTGADTYNKIGIITSASLADGTYIFKDHNSDEMKELRKAEGTEYAIANGLRTHNGKFGRWWTATSADAANLYGVVVTEEGVILIESGGEVNNKTDIGVRPFIMVNTEVTDVSN